MAQPNSTFFDELKAAARGCFALLVGNRQAPSFFDFSQRGLVGSLIAVLIAIGIGAFGMTMVGQAAAPGTATQSVVVNLALYGAQVGAAWLALRQMGRQDGFVPYLVASNWVALATIVLLMLSTALGPLGIVILAIVVVLALASFVNIGRFIVTLSPLQIGLLFIAELVGVFVLLAIIAMMLPPPLPPV